MLKKSLKKLLDVFRRAELLLALPVWSYESVAKLRFELHLNPQITIAS